MAGPTELNDLRHVVARGAYVVDPLAVADAMLSRDAVMLRPDSGSLGNGHRSRVLVAGQAHRPTAAVQQTGAVASLDAT